MLSLSHMKDLAMSTTALLLKMLRRNAEPLSRCLSSPGLLSKPEPASMAAASVSWSFPFRAAIKPFEASEL